MKNLLVTQLASRLALASVLAGWCAMPAYGADPARVGSYDFSYLLGGDARAKPVQVFDDGRSTYFQFRAGEAVPAIFAVSDGAPRFIVPSQEGPYVRVPEVHGRFMLQIGRAQASVVHAGADPRADAPQAIDSNSYATPTKGDQIYWTERTLRTEHAVGFARSSRMLSREAQRAVSRIAQDAASTARFIVVGRDDDSQKEGLEQGRAQVIRDALVKAGIASERITVQVGDANAGPSRKKGALWESTVFVETPQTATVMEMAPEAAPVARETVAADLAQDRRDQPASEPMPRTPPATGSLAASAAPMQAGRFPPPPPPPVIVDRAAMSPVPSWDAAAKKAAGVLSGRWEVGNNKSLRAIVEAWAGAAGVRVVWQSAHDYPVTETVKANAYAGTFREALMRLAMAFGELPVPLGMSFSSSGAQTLRVFDAPQRK
jgi:hypothetical protein